jgi:hypothetical protein
VRHPDIDKCYFWQRLPFSKLGFCHVPDEGWRRNRVKNLSLLKTGLHRDTLKDTTYPTMVREGVPLGT